MQNFLKKKKKHIFASRKKKDVAGDARMERGLHFSLSLLLPKGGKEKGRRRRQPLFLNAASLPNRKIAVLSDDSWKEEEEEEENGKRYDLLKRKKTSL